MSDATPPGAEVRALPIGVFDSGVGGLTVLRALEAALPDEHFIYLGDTARLPYGTKSQDTVRRYAEQAASVLVARGVKLLVVACNTASAVALDHLREVFAPLPVVGVVEPGAEAACERSASGVIGVIGTESTVAGGAYQRAIHRRRPGAQVRALATPLFVALAEEGWTDGEVSRGAARRYLGDLIELDRAGSEGLDCLVLGCTHFPVLAPALASVMEQLLPDRAVSLVDSAQTTARHVEGILSDRSLAAAPADEGGEPVSKVAHRRVRLLATDAIERFTRVGAVFLGRDLCADDVELTDL